jgi:hypothetical protein
MSKYGKRRRDKKFNMSGEIKVSVRIFFWQRYDDNKKNQGERRRTSTG